MVSYHIRLIIILGILFSQAASLPQAARKFLDHDAFYLITSKERKVFLKLEDDAQRNLFIEAFWTRRDPLPETGRNEFKEAFLERLAEGEERWGFHDPRTRFYAIFGPPDRTYPINCPSLFQPAQVWYYNRIPAIKGEAWLLFYQPMGMGRYRLYERGEEGDIVAHEAGGELCFDRIYVHKALSWTSFAFSSGDFQTLTGPPAVNLEGLKNIFKTTTYLSPGAKPLTLSLDLSFLKTRGPKVRVRGTIIVKGTTERLLDLVGEVVRGSHYADRFHFRYHYPQSDNRRLADFTRLLYPGTYNLNVKISSADGKYAGRLTQKIIVPSIGGETPQKIPTPPEISENFTLKGPDTSGALTGYQVFTVDAVTGLREVRFLLDGKPLLTCRKPPFTVELDLGEIPLSHAVTAEGFDEEGKLCGRDTLYLNEGIATTTLHIITPATGDRARPDTRFKALVMTPGDDPAKSLTLFLNDTPILQLFQPPWEATIHPPLTGTSILRALLETTKGVKREDVVMLNTSGFGEVVRVNVVSLYVTVTTATGKPVTNVKREDFTVFENGDAQPIVSVVPAESQPLTFGLLIDTSSSMERSLDEVRKAVRSFLTTTMRRDDRGVLIDFDTYPKVATAMTGNIDLLTNGLDTLYPDGSTALYDSITYGLYHLQGRGRRALILLTDGRDTSSHSTFKRVLDYAKRAAVPIYPIALKVSFTDVRIRHQLMALAQETGGRFIQAKKAEDLVPIYREISRELRSQVKITYRSTHRENTFRTINVKGPPHTRCRTIAGYYP